MLVIKEIIVEAFPKIRGGFPRFLRICLFRESHVTMYLIGGSGSQNGKPRGFCPSKEIFKAIFDRGDQVCRIISANIEKREENYEDGRN